MKINNTVKDSLLLSIAKVSLMVTGFIELAFLSRYFNKIQYGTYTQILTITQFVGTIFSLGFPACFSYFLPRYDSLKEKRKIISQILSLTFIMGILIFIVMNLTGTYISQSFKNPILNDFNNIIAVLPLIFIINSYFSNIYVAIEKAPYAALLSIIFNLMRLLPVIFVFLFKFDLETFVYLSASVKLLNTLVIILLIIKDFKGFKPFFFNKTLLKEILTYALPLGFSTMVSTAIIYTDKIIISAFYSPEQFAIYFNGAKEFPISILTASITAILIPKAVKHLHNNNMEKAFSLWKKSMLISCIIIFYAFFLLSLTTKEFITFVYSAEYTASVPIYQVYLFIIVARLTYCGLMLSASGKSQFILISTTIGLLLNIILNLALISVLGFIGVALSSVISIFIINILQICYTMYKFKIKLNNIFNFKAIFKIFLANIFIFIPLWMVKKFMFPDLDSFTSLAIFAAFYSFLYLIILKFVLKINIKEILKGHINL